MGNPRLCLSCAWFGAEGRIRTGTGFNSQRFLRPPRLPFRHFGLLRAAKGPAGLQVHYPQGGWQGQRLWAPSSSQAARARRVCPPAHPRRCILATPQPSPAREGCARSDSPISSLSASRDTSRPGLSQTCGDAMTVSGTLPGGGRNRTGAWCGWTRPTTPWSGEVRAPLGGASAVSCG